MVDIRMPFGKYFGVLLEDIPKSYLAWVLGNCDMHPFFLDAVRAELARPRRPPRPRKTVQQSSPPSSWSTVITKWFRGLALDFHPDRGGSVEAMKAINEAHDRLRQLVGA